MEELEIESEVTTSETTPCTGESEKRKCDSNNDGGNKRNGILIGVIIVLALLFVISLATCGSVLLSKGIKQEVNLHVTTPVVGGANENAVSAPVDTMESGFIDADDLVISTETVNSNEVNKDPLEDRKVFFYGYDDKTITKTTTIALCNPKENLDFYMMYEILDEKGNVVFETDLIPSGQSLIWVPGETLSVGEHKLSFLYVPYYQNSDGTWRKLTSGNCEVTYTIK